jgi:membrane protein YqaA with SNARE-associated domain
MEDRAKAWLHRMGPAALLFAWLPAVGDPLCAVAGWLRLAFWPCVAYMAISKFLRYVAMAASLLWVFPTV